jgi:hypothetical protein
MGSNFKSRVSHHQQVSPTTNEVSQDSTSIASAPVAPDSAERPNPPEELGIYFTDVFGIDPEILDDYGAFNVSLVNDLPLFIDPFLLFNSENPEYRSIHDSLIRYLRFLRDKSVGGMVNEGLLKAWFTFSEVKQNWLGFSLVGNEGSGLGVDFARALNRNLNTIFATFGQDNGITRGNHLEKLCLIKEGVGRDNISDFTTVLMKEFLLTYTQKFAREHMSPANVQPFTVERVRFNYDTESWEHGRLDLPSFNEDYVLLTPKDLLTKDQIWINRDDLLNSVETLADALPNDVLRSQIDNYFVKQLSHREEPSQKEIRAARAATVEAFPELIEHYIRDKEDHGDDAEAVSAARVQAAYTLYVEEVKQLRLLLAHETAFYSLRGKTFSEARKRIIFLKDVIENKDGYRAFYDAKGKLITREEHLQIFYRLTWFGSASDVNREVNNGRGPVDFKISRGAKDSTLVEFKLASNKALKKNLQKQVEIYQKASNTPGAIKVITFFTEGEEARVLKILRELNLTDHPNVILIDARKDNKPSASKA